MLYYFAYGSNLHHLQMKRRCPNCSFIKKISLINANLLIMWYAMENSKPPIKYE